MNTDAKWRRHTFEKGQLAARIRRNVRPLLDDEATERAIRLDETERKVYGSGFVFNDGTDPVFGLRPGTLNYGEPVQRIIDADFEVVEQRLLAHYSSDLLKDWVEKIAREDDLEHLVPAIDMEAVACEVEQIMGLTKRPTYMASLRRRIASAFKFLLFGIGSGA